MTGDRGSDQINASKVLAFQGDSRGGAAGTLIGSAGDNSLRRQRQRLLNGARAFDSLRRTFFSANLVGQAERWRHRPVRIGLRTSAGADAILDFRPGIDTIVLFDGEVFEAVGKSVDLDEFHIGKGAADPNDHLVYNARTGALFFDPNGSDDGMAIKIATLSRGLPLMATDFFVMLS